MFRILDRYIFREIAQTWLAVTMVLLFILLTNQFARVLGDVAWFYAPTPENGFELWRSDGTTGGTVLAMEFNPGPANSIDGETSFALLGQSLITGADDGVNGMEVWRVAIGQ